MTGSRDRTFRTVDLARAALTHENTVRLYVEWGFLARPERAPNGYRLWNQDHVDQMVFARRALHGEWPGRRIRESALALVRLAAGEPLDDAIAASRCHADLVRDERRRAEEAAAFLDAWANGADGAEARSGGAAALAGAPNFLPPEEGRRLGPREAAEAVGATMDQVRNWERNRLLDPPREGSGKRSYGRSELGRLRVIRGLLLAGYSVMAILRMTTELDRGRTTGLREILDTPRGGEEVLTAFDRWLSSLALQEARAEELTALLEARKTRRASDRFS